MGCHVYVLKRLDKVSGKRLKADLDRFVDESRRWWFRDSDPYEYAEEMLEFYAESLPSLRASLAMLEKNGDEKAAEETRCVIKDYESQTKESVLKEAADDDRKTAEMDAAWTKESPEFDVDGPLPPEKLRRYDGFWRFFDKAGYRDDGWYEIYFDTVFRIYGYPGVSFDDSEKLIDWMRTYDQSMIVDYGENCRPLKKRGLTPRLEEKIRRLWSDNGGAIRVETDG